MTRLQLLLAFLLALRLLPGQWASPNAPEYTGCGGASAPVDNPAYEQQVVELVNQARLESQLPPLKRVKELDEAAVYHAVDMAQDRYFQHDSYDLVDGKLTFVCAWSSRVGSFYSGWSSLAENLAIGYATPAAVMNGWLNSAGHKSNILSAGNWEIGVGYSSQGAYWAQDFGQRSGVYPLVIDREADATGSLSVSIYVYGTWKEIRLRNEDGPWSAW
ncbi:MAG TPA: CAP domain-containing protein [Anaerolineales bacterium]